MKFLSKRVKITDVKLGELVRGHDIVNQTDVFRKVLNTMRPIVEHDQQVRIVTANGSLTTSKTHPTAKFTDDKIEYVPGKNICIGDSIVVDGLPISVIDITAPNVSTQYADFSVDETENYYAGDTKDQLILAHNSATVTFPIWHAQFEDLIVLKNNQGTDETRVRHMDYSVVLSGLFWKRLLDGKEITLFDPSQVPDLYEAFYSDIELFDQLYVTYEARKDLKVKRLSAEAVIKTMMLKERTDTGRIYMVFIDNVQRQGPFDTKVHPIYQSNLCQEILLPTKAFQRVEDPSGRIALCTLGSINWGAFRNPEDMKRACRVLVRSLCNLLKYQDFLSIQSKLSNDEIMPLGIGVTNLAYWHAKRGMKYGEGEALAEVKRWMEHQAFFLTEVSVELAAEKGACLHSSKTYYGKGIFPWERRAPGVNELTDFSPELDWEPLRAKMKEHGIRNATLMAIAPVESSSVVINSTNGIELPMSLISIKESKGSLLAHVVPEYTRLKGKYQLMWEQADCVEYLKTAAVLAAYVDQSISTNTFYNPKFFTNEDPKKDRKVPTQLAIRNLMLGYKWGLKTFYYSLINKQGVKADKDVPAQEPKVNPVTFNPVIEDDDCEACKL